MPILVIFFKFLALLFLASFAYQTFRFAQYIPETNYKWHPDIWEHFVIWSFIIFIWVAIRL